MNEDVLTLDTLRKAVAALQRENSLRRVVRTAEEAERMTRRDPFGYEWQVGEEYYLLEYDA